MKSSTERAVDLTEYLFKLPDRRIVIAVSLLVCILVGIAGAFIVWGQLAPAVLYAGIITGLLLYAVPLVLFCLTVWTLKRIKFDYLAAIYTAANIVLIISLALSVVIGPAAIPVGIGLVCVMWFVAGKILFNLRYTAWMLPVLYMFYQFVLSAVLSSVLLGSAVNAVGLTQFTFLRLRSHPQSFL